MRAHRPTPELAQHLEQLYERFPFDRSFADDPISTIRPLATDRRRGEVAGIVGALSLIHISEPTRP